MQEQQGSTGPTASGARQKARHTTSRRSWPSWRCRRRRAAPPRLAAAQLFPDRARGGGPCAITLYIAWCFINIVDAWVKPYIPGAYNPDTYMTFPIPGVGLIFAIVGLTLIGALAANLLGRSLISAGEMSVGRTPIVRNVYRGLKQNLGVGGDGLGAGPGVRVGRADRVPLQGHLVDRVVRARRRMRLPLGSAMTT